MDGRRDLVREVERRIDVHATDRRGPRPREQGRTGQSPPMSTAAGVTLRTGTQYWALAPLALPELLAARCMAVLKCCRLCLHRCVVRSTQAACTRQRGALDCQRLGRPRRILASPLAELWLLRHGGVASSCSVGGCGSGLTCRLLVTAAVVCVCIPPRARCAHHATG